MKMILFILFFQLNAYGAACCGGSSAIPSLITGDNEAQFSISQSAGKVIGRTYAKDKSVFYGDNKSYRTLMTSIKGAYLLSPLWQVGLGISVLRKDNSESGLNESKTMLGDSDLSIGYEFLPETFYSLWKPRGFVYYKHVLPTGRSNYEASTTLLTDVSGKGQHISSVGLVFTKAIKSIDWQIFGEYKYIYSEDIGGKRISSSQGNSEGFNIGYSPANGPVRASFGATRNHFSDKEIITNSTKQNSKREEYWDFELSSSFMVNDSTFTLSYVDQTILGPTENTTLSRTISISWLERWPL